MIMMHLRILIAAKRLCSLVLLLCSSSIIHAQGVAINSTGDPAAPSAGLDIQFNNKGLLIPRLTTAERDAISNPEPGLQIINITTKSLFKFS